MLEDPQKNSTSKISSFLEKKCQKWLYWVLANSKRNTVMIFGEPSTCSVDTVNGFMVQRPPRWNRVYIFSACLDTLLIVELLLKPSPPMILSLTNLGLIWIFFLDFTMVLLIGKLYIILRLQM